MDRSIRRALISVSDKTGLVEFATALASMSVMLVSTGGTAATLRAAGLSVADVSELTGFPEMLDGRVKTLHPGVHAALLARRDDPEHMRTLVSAAIEPIDMLVVNLYPFVETVARPDCTLEQAIENIDIGGPAMVRAAAKNHEGVTVITSPDDYGPVLSELRDRSGTISAQTRFSLASKAFAHTAAYDSAVSNYLCSLGADGSRAEFPVTLSLQFHRVQDMRYGENPHQAAAFYRDPRPAPGSIASYRQIQGKDLSYNNIADSDAAWECVRGFDRPACVIVKHANPCGVAIGTGCLDAYRKAFATDPTSAFGGIIAFNREVDAETAQAVAGQFVEVVIAPACSAEAIGIFSAKQNVRVLVIPSGGSAATGLRLDLKRVGGGLLVQTPDERVLAPQEFRVVTRRKPGDRELEDLMFAWRVAKYVKSNAIVFCHDGRTVGIGAGQMSRVDSARIAALKAQGAGLILAGSSVASDAFFPFRDGVDVVAEAGARSIVQPGGSVRDAEVIAAADERDIAMVFTGVRHFRH